MRHHKHCAAAVQILGFAALAAGTAAYLSLGGGEPRYNWQWYRIPGYLVLVTEEGVRPGLLVQGLLVTLKISAAGLAAAFVIGLAAALLRISRSFTARLIARVYLEAVRNTPLPSSSFSSISSSPPYSASGPSSPRCSRSACSKARTPPR